MRVNSYKRLRGPGWPGLLLLPGLLLAGDRLLRALAGAGIGLGSLTAYGQPAAPPQAFVTTNLDLPADVCLDLATEVPLDLAVFFDVVPQLDEVLIGEILGTQIRAHPGGVEDLVRAGTADTVDVGQRDLHPLVAGKVHAGESCHPRRVSCLVVTRSAPHPSRMAAAPPTGPGLAPGGDTDPVWIGWRGEVVSRRSIGLSISKAVPAHPWRCLWRRFSQITITTPWRRITLHLSQIFLTLAFTFTSSLLVAGPGQRPGPLVVWWCLPCSGRRCGAGTDRRATAPRPPDPRAR